MADRDGRDSGETVREAVERSQSGAPAVGSVVRDRFSADEVFQRIVAAADEEITSGSRELFFSALAGGFAITITFLLYAAMAASSDGDPVLSALLYPLGFIYIILGGYQLYTENTLPPVALTLERLASVPALLRIWAIVLAGNFAGGALGAAALAYGNVLAPEAATAAFEIASHGVETGWWPLFTKAAFAGLIVAGVVWVDYAARDTTTRLVVVYLAFLAIPLGGLYHVVVSFTEMLYLVLIGEFPILVGATQFVLPVLLGNTLGGVVLVTVVNYFQTSERRLESARFQGIDRQLSIREWLLGGIVGRSYVPLVDTGEVAGIGGDAPFRVLVPIANPRTESATVELACNLARPEEGAVVHVVHVVELPDRSAGAFGFGQRRRIVEESERLMEDFHAIANGAGVDLETSTVVTHRSFEELFTIADRTNADLALIGWGEDQLWEAGRTVRPLDELTNRLPCDFLVFRDRGLDVSRLQLPVAGGSNAELNAEVARALRAVEGSEVTLLHVVDGPDEREAGERFLAEWAADNGLDDAEIRVDDSGDVERVIVREAADHTLLMMGATERGLLARLVTDSLHMDVLAETEGSVLLAEQATPRSLVDRLVGR